MSEVGHRIPNPWHPDGTPMVDEPRWSHLISPKCECEPVPEVLPDGRTLYQHNP